MGWRNYKHRLIPWLAFNWSTRLVKKVKAKNDMQGEAQNLLQITRLCESLEQCLPHAYTIREWKNIASDIQTPASIPVLASKAKEVVKKDYGVALSLQPSEVVGGAGIGVFTRCDLPEGKLVGLYPGTLYLPFEPLFFQSLGNQFLFRCSNGYIIDGKSTGLSNKIYLSCAYRDAVGGVLSCDPSWLMKSDSLNPLSVGQFVNNHTRSIESNVEYIEVGIPTDFPHSWYRFLPNVFYSSSDLENQSRLLTVVGLCTTRPVRSGEELLSSYLTIVTN